MKYALMISMVLMMGISLVSAETGTIVLVSDNYADCAVAEALVEENNATIVKTTWGEFEQSVLDAIVEASPSDVIIIGGPAAVVDQYETDLEDAGITVERLWGSTRQQTSMMVFENFRSRYNWSAAVGDGSQPYRMAGRFPVWFYDNESEVDSFMAQHRATVMNYGMARRFAGRYGLPDVEVTPAQVENFGDQVRLRIQTMYGNHTWMRQQMGSLGGMGPGPGMGRY